MKKVVVIGGGVDVTSKQRGEFISNNFDEIIIIFVAKLNIQCCKILKNIADFFQGCVTSRFAALLVATLRKFRFFKTD